MNPLHIFDQPVIELPFENFGSILVQDVFLNGAFIQAVGGLLATVLFFRYRNHCPTGLLFLTTLGFFALSSVLALQFIPLEPSRHLLWGFLPFYSSSMFFVPPIVSMLVQTISNFVDGLTQDGKAGPKTERLFDASKAGWPEIRQLMGQLAKQPENGTIRSRIAEIYLSMAYYESALSEYRRLEEIVPRGYDHAQVLHKIAYIIVEKKNQPQLAVSTLRQIVRLYPKSYFAAYARRWLNHVEAHTVITNEE